jgi:hypothetical protein
MNVSCPLPSSETISLPPATSTMPGQPSVSGLFQYTEPAWQPGCGSWAASSQLPPQVYSKRCRMPAPPFQGILGLSNAPFMFCPPFPVAESVPKRCQSWAISVKSNNDQIVLWSLKSLYLVIKLLSCISWLGLVIQHCSWASSSCTIHRVPAARLEHIFRATTDTRSSRFDCNHRFNRLSASSLKLPHSQHITLPPHPPQVLMRARSWLPSSASIVQLQQVFYELVALYDSCV